MSLSNAMLFKESARLFIMFNGEKVEAWTKQ
jgi:hypothetical protein